MNRTGCRKVNGIFVFFIESERKRSVRLFTDFNELAAAALEIILNSRKSIGCVKNQNWDKEGF